MRAVALGGAGVLTGSQALVAGACFFLALALGNYSNRTSSNVLGRIIETLAPARLFSGAVAISMSASLAGYNLNLIQSGIALHKVNPIAILVAGLSMLLGHPERNALAAGARWILPLKRNYELDPDVAPAVVSFIIFVGVVANVAQATALDSLASILVAGLIFRFGWRLMVDA